jgi:shikimate kinase/3-dehydroquinate synthase
MRTDGGIALTGFMGAGKSTVGRALAGKLGLPFVDLDARIEEEHGPIPAIFASRGEAAFRSLERKALQAVLEQAVSEPIVVALGGGALVDPRSRLAVERTLHTVFLDIPLETAGARIGAASGRPVWSEAEARYASRTAIYASARSRVDATQPVDDVVQAVISATRPLERPRTEAVRVPGSPYEAVLARGFSGLAAFLRTALPSGDLRIVTDDQVGPRWADALEAELGCSPDARIVFPAGEASKTVATWSTVVDALIATATTRTTGVVALGGGVVGDLAGFAAATVNRGVPFVQVPTTTLAMVDSSVGGKTAVNHARGKNLIGAFHQPRAVWMALDTLATLPVRHRRAGLAEILKAGAVLDTALLDVVDVGATLLRDGDPAALEHAIALGVRAKARVVAEDERERGLRMVLNAGHTVAHAIERAADYGTVLHGEAVAIGLVVETRWAERRGLCSPGLADRLADIATRLGLPVELPRDLDPVTLRDAMVVDKKATRDILSLPVATRAGAHQRVQIPLDQVGTLVPETR